MVPTSSALAHTLEINNDIVSSVGGIVKSVFLPRRNPGITPQKLIERGEERLSVGVIGTMRSWVLQWGQTPIVRFPLELSAKWGAPKPSHIALRTEEILRVKNFCGVTPEGSPQA